MSGKKGIKKKEVHSEASGIEELIPILPLYALWGRRQATNQIPRNVSAELPVTTLISAVQPHSCITGTFPASFPVPRLKQEYGIVLIP